jgi:integrase
LKVTDIDLIGKRLLVERAMEEGDKEVKVCKTYEQRWVELNCAILDYLNEYLLWLKAEAIAAGRPVEWLFPSEKWTFISERNAARSFSTVCEQAQLPGRSQYDCRHTYASLLLSKCAAPGYVQKQMGHKTLDMTLRVYATYVKAGDVRYCELLCKPVEPASDFHNGFHNTQPTP